MANKNAASASTTQKYLDVFDITNDLIILNDGSVALVIMVSAMNFGLLSEDEQDATIYAYAALLNSLSYPVQIVIRSQPKDVTSYLKLVEQKENETLNPLYKQRIREYRNFIESMVQEQNVLDKKFYFVIPLTGIDMGLATASVIPGKKTSKTITSYDKSFIIDKAKINLEPRRDHLIDQLARIGLYSRQLTTQELIQMLYNSYNPESFEGLQVTDTKNYTTPLVQAQILGDLNMMDASTPATTPATPTTTPAPAAPSMATITPVAPVTPSVTETPATPGLGVTTPIDMGSTPIASTMPGLEASATPSTPAAPVSTGTSAPMPTQATSAPVVAEAPFVSTPPVGTTPSSTPSTGATDTPAPEQELINQTLNQLGSAPVSTPAVSTPASPAPEV